VFKKVYLFRKMNVEIKEKNLQRLTASI